jgi:hypothetical protein
MKLGGRANKLMDHNIAHVNKPSVILIFNDEAAKQHDVERIDTVTVSSLTILLTLRMQVLIHWTSMTLVSKLGNPESL